MRIESRKSILFWKVDLKVESRKSILFWKVDLPPESRSYFRVAWYDFYRESRLKVGATSGYFGATLVPHWCHILLWVLVAAVPHRWFTPCHID